MRKDVLALIVGWTMIALIAPLALCFIVTWVMDGFAMAAQSFMIPTILSGMIGMLLLGYYVRTDTSERLRDREAFAAVALAWPFAVLIGSLPFWLSGVFHGPFTDSSLMDVMRGAINSWFESMSGFTTTGATVIDYSMSPNCIAGVTADCINSQPKGVLLWRSMTQWLGGMGIIMLGMLMLSRILGGGMALARAELTGPSLSRLRPRVQQTALTLWSIYFVLTVLEILLLVSIGGLSAFDAINHGLTTMPSGGFSTHDASIGFYDSALVETIILVFMLLAGINFTLIWFAWEGQWKKSFGDEEGRLFIGMLTVITLFITFVLYASDSADSGFRDAVFTVVSMGTTTGYVITDYGIWPVITHVLIILLMIVGGCAGSTAGGLKVLRINLAFKVAIREIGRITQPRKVQRIRMNGEVVQRERLGMIVGMLFVWIMLFSLACIALAFFMQDADFETIFSVVATSLGNTGPALGSYGPSTTWAEMNSGALITTSALMWFGRLELLTALLLLHPNTWKREKRDAPGRTSMKLFKNIFSKR